MRSNEAEVQIVPAIIPESLEDLKEHLVRVRDFASLVQIDVMDGVYSPDPSWPYNSAESRRGFKEIVMQQEGLPYWKDLNFEIDMLIVSPEQYMDEWIDAGAASLVVYVDSTERFNDIIEKAHQKGVVVGAGLKPSIDREEVQDEIEAADFIQVMGNDEVGFHGVDLDESVYNILSELKEEYPHKSIGVDIGVDENTAPKLIEAGADRLMSGSYIFEAQDVEEAIRTLKGS